MDLRRFDRTALLFLTALALASRLAFRIDYHEDIDALRFSLGVVRFDAGELRPHAPFYPVYIAAAKLVALTGVSARGALGVVSAASGAATVAATALLAREALGRRAAYLAGAFALASPFLWLTSEKLMSDMPGAAVTTAALWLCARARRLAAEGEPSRAATSRTSALVLLGIGLGVRLSYFPVAFACAAVIALHEGGGRSWAARARDLCAGALLWLVPLVLVAQARPLVATTWAQATGHFTRWGGSALTVSSPAARLHGIAWGLWANALGGAWPDAPSARWLTAPLLLMLLGLAVVRALRGGGLRAVWRAQPELVASSIAYFTWAALGQNTAYKPRHLLPLAPVLMIALAAGADALLERARASRTALVAAWIAVGLLCVQALADGAALARAHLAPSPAAAIARFVAQPSEPDTRPVVTRDLALLLTEAAPRRRIVRVTSDQALLAAVKNAGPAGALITTEALSPAVLAELHARGHTLRTAFARPRSRYIDSLWSELSLLEARPPQDASPIE